MTATVSGNQAAQPRSAGADALRRAAQSESARPPRRAPTPRSASSSRKRRTSIQVGCRAAGVSLDFLYASTELRQRIEKLRGQQAARTASRVPHSPQPRSRTTSRTS